MEGEKEVAYMVEGQEYVDTYYELRACYDSSFVNMLIDNAKMLSKE